MLRRGILVANKRNGQGYFGDYYIFAGKRSQFYYCAISRCTAFALSKDFIYNNLFEMFPNLRSDMLATSFARYIREFRKPCEKVRKKMISEINKKRQYCTISPDFEKRLDRSLTLLKKRGIPADRKRQISEKDEAPLL
jgi:UDP:flavonoid glycosyltransferase YjiC (YdhE family)